MRALRSRFTGTGFKPLKATVAKSYGSGRLSKSVEN